MLIDLSFAASRGSTFSGPTIKAAMPASPADRKRCCGGLNGDGVPRQLAVHSRERGSLFLKGGEPR